MPLAEHVEEEIVVGMYDRGLLGFPEDGITLKSGRHSPYYYNMRNALSLSSKLDRSGQMPWEAQKRFRQRLIVGTAAMFKEIKRPIDHVFGKAQAGTAIAAVAAYEADMSYLWERVDEPGKTYGYHQKLEGDFEEGDKILIADDVVTDGLSKRQGAQVLSAAGLVPVAITLQFDREEGGVQTLEEYDFEVNSLTTLTKAAHYLRTNGRIDDRAVGALQKYHEGLRDDGLVTTFSYQR